MGCHPPTHLIAQVSTVHSQFEQLNWNIVTKSVKLNWARVHSCHGNVIVDGLSIVAIFQRYSRVGRLIILSTGVCTAQLQNTPSVVIIRQLSLKYLNSSTVVWESRCPLNDYETFIENHYFKCKVFFNNTHDSEINKSLHLTKSVIP